MTTTNQNFTMWSGDDKSIVVTVTDGTSAVNITGATVNYTLQPSVSDATGAVTKATGGSGIVLTTPASGIFTITLDAADTTSLSGAYYHEAQVTEAGGDISTVLTGQVTIEVDAI